MNLTIRNIGKIKSADIKFDGITVVAGQNDTGKSTIGEVLGSFFTTFSNLDYKINYYRYREIKRIVVAFFHEYAHKPYNLNKKRIDDFVNKLCNSENKFQKIDSFISEFTQTFDIVDFNRENFYSSLEKILKYSDEDISRSITSSLFTAALDGKLHSVYTKEDAIITVIIKNIKSIISFNGNGLNELNIPLHINNTATYINNPFCINQLESDIHGKNYFEDDLLYKLTNSVTDDFDESKNIPFWKNEEPVAKLRMNEFLGESAETLNSVVPGKLLYTDKYVYKTENGEDIDVASLSTGMKSFMIIKQLLEKNQLREKDILILDEPEIHLHPEWQLKYARLIVLLQKEYNLTVLITTHSSTFLEAIDLYSQKYKISEKCNYYISKVTESDKMVTFQDVKNNLAVVYKELVTPSIALLRLKESLNESEAN